MAINQLFELLNQIDKWLGRGGVIRTAHLASYWGAKAEEVMSSKPRRHLFVLSTTSPREVVIVYSYRAGNFSCLIDCYPPSSLPCLRC